MALGTASPESVPTPRASMDPMRKTALWAGAMYVLTFVSIPSFALYGPVKESGYVAGAGADTGVFVGGVLELIVGLAGIGTAVALYPVVKRQNQAVAMGFVGTRVLEAATIFLGVASLWTIVTLRQNGAGADAGLIGEALVAFYDRAFLVGQSFIPAINALLIGSLMYQSRSGAAGSSRAWIHGSGRPCFLSYRRGRRVLRRRCVGHCFVRGTPHRYLGVRAGRLPHREGLPTGGCGRTRHRAGRSRHTVARSFRIPLIGQIDHRTSV